MLAWLVPEESPPFQCPSPSTGLHVGHPGHENLGYCPQGYCQEAAPRGTAGVGARHGSHPSHWNCQGFSSRGVPKIPPDPGFLAVLQWELYLELERWNCSMSHTGLCFWEEGTAIPAFPSAFPRETPEGQLPAAGFLEHGSHTGTVRGFRHLLSLPISFIKFHWCLIKNLIICPLKLAPAGAGRQPGLSRLQFPWLRSLQRSHLHRESYFGQLFA